ncbi:MAG TPA: DNA-processing protein DprA [Chloroflexia bacterium]|nr:DNA-processing protein DprA [Chloroflexia bacterium]
MPLVEDEKRFVAGEEKYWLAFSRVSGIGLVRLRRLFDYFGGLGEAWQASSGQLLTAGLEPKLTGRLLQFRQSFDPDGEMSRLEKLGIKLLVLDGPDYPERLAQIDNPPPVLYLKGELTPADSMALAVVGTRRASSYGRQATSQICAELAQQGITIVSGLAKGIDTVAHQAALDAGGRTLAVLGCGVDIIYPPENRGLAARILNPAELNGAILSEYAPGTQPDAVNFPPRNRIVSGLSLGVFIVESGEKGGALITVNFANEQGRDIFALPGSIYNPLSIGTNSLIRRGNARLVTSAADILEEIRPGGLFDAEDRQTRAEIAQAGDTEAEKSIIRSLRQAGEPLHIDEISRECNLPMSEISGVLVLMELKGLVQSMGGMRYALTRLVS